jgi:hypothetical protein
LNFPSPLHSLPWNSSSLSKRFYYFNSKVFVKMSHIN